MIRPVAASLCACLAFAPTAHAERPPARGRASPTLLAGTVVDTGTAGARFLATLPAASREAVQRNGQVLLDTPTSGTRDGTIRAVLRFDRPRDEVFAILSRPSEQSRYLPGVTQSKTVARTDEGERNDIKVSVLFTIAFRTQSWFYPEAHRIEWSLDPSAEGDLSAQEGFFQLYELDEKTTLAEYGTRVVAKGGLLEFLRGLGARGGVTDALTATRRHVASSKP